MSIIHADKSNLKDWVGLSVKLFPHHSFDEMYNEYSKFLITGKEMGFLYQLHNRIVGFLNLSIRNDYVNGTDSSPVAFIEAVYVLPEYRRQGIARELVAYAEKFTNDRGIKQLASDCLLDNKESELFHKGCCFQETERVIYFVKNV